MTSLEVAAIDSELGLTPEIRAWAAERSPRAIRLLEAGARARDGADYRRHATPLIRNWREAQPKKVTVALVHSRLLGCDVIVTDGEFDQALVELSDNDKEFLEGKLAVTSVEAEVMAKAAGRLDWIREVVRVKRFFGGELRQLDIFAAPPPVPMNGNGHEP